MKIQTGLQISALILLCTGLVRSAHAEEKPSSKKIDFARQILPILSNKCFVCHGPDAKSKKILRLDSYEGATRDLDGYKAIDPDHPKKSELIARIHDKDSPMPPKRAEKKLTDPERKLLTQWVLQGGSYALHWAFIPPQKQSPPASTQEAHNAIDLFILDRLRQNGTRPAAEADPQTLARRAALVLTGLPPEPDQLSRFLNDPRPDAYERLIDSLLASPGYGEHQTRYWLDAIRYGDTHGLHLDNRRGIYPYRDWVVRAMNRNLPLDRFLLWQIAGDLLPNPTLEQKVATGFIRMNPTTAEGGAIPAEFQAKNNFDRTETLGTVLLGMSLTCARCHTHKYDPIQQKEYYQLFAYFNSTAEHSMDGNAYVYGPSVKAPSTVSEWDRWAALQQQKEDLLARTNFSKAIQSPQAVAYSQSREKWSTAQWQQSKPIKNEDAPQELKWSKIAGLPGTSRAKLPGPDQSLWVSFQVKVPNDQVLFLSHSGGPGSLIEINGKPWTHSDKLQSTYLPLPLNKGDQQVRIKMAGSSSRPAIQVQLHNPWSALARKQSPGEIDALLMLADPIGLFAEHSLETQAIALARELTLAQKTYTTTLVAKDLPKPRKTQILERGEYNRPIGEPVQPGVLTVMGKLPKDAPSNRLGLAQWLTSNRHPLVARVWINRVWQRVFGHAIVRTPEDFGVQGRQPTHPELLDWLAVELQESGWNLKHMLRLMVTSRTFRQQSHWRKDVDDPQNLLLARGPRFRLDAEVLRDLGLWASGLLEPTMGGEGIKPYQPSGLWQALAHPASNTKRYQQDQGQRLYRRSLYVYWKRTSPHPMMTLFDAPSREASCVRRARTNTPLQSLGLLNESQRLEMARVFAERLLRQAKTDKDRIDLLFRLLACRKATEIEQSACQTLLKAMKQRYEKSQKDAITLISHGPAPRDKTLSPMDHAAWTQVAIVVLASDVALMVY